jgi:hypothetical protein
MGKMRNAYKIITGNTEGSRPFGRFNRRWKIILKLIL